MSPRATFPVFQRFGWAGALPVRFFLVLILVGAGGLASLAGENQAAPKPAAQRVAVGQYDGVAGSLLEREAPRMPWQVAKPTSKVFTGDLVLALPGLRANLDIKEAVRLTLVGALPQPSAQPVLESAVVLNQHPGADLDVTLNRGRILVAQRKAKGTSLVRVHFGDQNWDLVLEEPGTEVALELVSRWPPGVPYEKTPRPGHGPTTDVYLLLLKGRVLLGNGSDQRTLRGQVVYQWSPGRGVLGPVPLKDLPAWVNPEGTLTPRERSQILAAGALRQRLADGDVARALQQTLEGEDPEARVLAVYGAGATDNLPLLLAGLRNAKHPEVRGAAVAALRYWIGRAAGQDQQLFEALAKADYRAGQAEIILQLLHTFSAEDVTRPEAFETLIAYLNHDKIAIRELAAWHLTRLVPQGRDIPLNAGASAEERAQSLAAWRRLIPAGRLPPPVKAK